MIDYRVQLLPALQAVRITSPTSFAWFGRRSPPLLPAVRATLDPAQAREHLVGAIARALYTRFYAHGRPMAIDDADRADQSAPHDAFIRALSQANGGRGGWDPGWTTLAVDGDRATVMRGGLRVVVTGDDCRPRAAALAPGQPVSLRREHEHRALLPGFYLARGDAHADADAADAMSLRIYFNVRPSGAPALVRECTSRLNAAGIVFTLKLLADPARFQRCDAAVLYVGAGTFARVREPLGAIAAACGSRLDAGHVAFIAPLASGVGLAEYASSGHESFGTSRCRLVAEGLVALGTTRRAARPADLLDAVASRFAAAGLDLDAPYREAGSSACYEL